MVYFEYSEQYRKRRCFLNCEFQKGTKIVDKC